MHQIPIISNIQYFIPFRHVVSEENSSFINVKNQGEYLMFCLIIF